MRKIIYILVVSTALGVTGLIVLGSTLAASRMNDIGASPKGFNAEKVKINSSNDHEISGWFVEGEKTKPGILLLHSIRSDRREMVGRGKFLISAGYSVLLIDMQAHGETPGENITFGFQESNDAHAALNFLKNKIDGRKTGVIGVSLGGASALLGKSPLKADAVVLEGVYSSIEKAIENRISIRLGKLGAYLAPLLSWQIQPRLGVKVEELSPHLAISKLASPVFILVGSEDKHTNVEETRLLFEQAKEPKDLWIIDGAKHQNLHIFAGAEYEKRILQFFKQHLEEKPNA